MVHVLVVDDHPSVREGTKAILEAEDGIKVSTLNPPFTVEAIQQHEFNQYDIVLMDMNLGESNGIELSKAILELNELSKIILFTGFDVTDYMEDALNVGLYGVISKTESKENLLCYIDQAMNGNIIIPYSLYRDLFIQKKIEKDTMLNEREKSILIEIEKGLTNQDVADKLHLSKRSIEYSLTTIYNKLGCNGRTEAVLIAKAKGIIE